jgi:hypothetical protein
VRDDEVVTVLREYAVAQDCFLAASTSFDEVSVSVVVEAHFVLWHGVSFQ